jgi:hypothetical protein
MRLQSFTVAAARSLSCGFLFLASQAAASPGCDALQGSVSQSGGGPVTNTGSAIGTGFSAGDIISVTRLSGLVDSRLFDNTGSVALVGYTPNSFTYVVPADTNHQLLVQAVPLNTGAASWTCTNAPAKAANSSNSSQLLEQIRQQFSKIVAATTSTSTGESVSGAITEAFNGGGTTQAGNGRISTSFAAFENDAADRAAPDHAREAYAALGYATNTGPGVVAKAASPRVAPSPLYGSPWHVWIDARYTATDDRRVTSFDGRQTNVTGGISYRFNERFLAGLVTGYENFNYDLGLRSGQLDGNGWNAGGYFGWRFWDRLRLDGMLTYGKINYGTQADNVTGGFDASRVTSMLRVSGRYGLATGWYVEPSGRLIYASEKQDAFVDTAGVIHSRYSFDVGLASFGGEIGAPTIWGNWIVTPSLGLYGDYRFGTDSVQTVATLPNLDDGWSARVTGDLRWSAPNGFSAAVGGQYGGLGSDTRYWQAKASLGVKF